MFENILSEKVLNFNDLEREVYKFVCNLGCEIIKNYLEDQDEILMKERKTNTYRNKGFKRNCIKTIMGEVIYKRRIYKELDTNKHSFLLDDTLSINNNGKISNNLIEKTLETVVQTTSYRKASNQINKTTNIVLSHETVRKITMQAGEKIDFYEQELVKNKKEKILREGTRIIPILFEEADGLWINLQGKDRRQQLEDLQYKMENKGKKYVNPKSVKAELKLHEMYEGWKKDDERHSLVNKTYIAGFMTSNELRQIRDAKVFCKYKEEEIQYRVLNGDGAGWINKLATKKMIRQKDRFHIHQEITKRIDDKAECDKIRRMFEKKQYNEIIPYIEELKYKSGGEEHIVKKLENLQLYLKYDLKRYTDLIDLPKAPEGIEYRTLGTMESQIFSVLCKRLKGRKSFSKYGATNLAKVCAKFEENKKNIDYERIVPEIYLETEKIEENQYVEELTHKAKENFIAYTESVRGCGKVAEEHTIKNILISDNEKYIAKSIKDMIKFIPNSELDYWPSIYW